MNNYIITEKTNFNEIRPTEGYVLTSYTDGDDIMTYYSTTIICAPKAVDIEAKYKAITIEEDAKLKEAKELKMKELERIFHIFLSNFLLDFFIISIRHYKSAPLSQNSILWLFFSKTQPADQVIQEDCYQNQREPERHELRAHLAQEVSGQVGIIPDAQPKPYVDDEAGGKLQNRDEDVPCHDLGRQRHFPW